tara:strand:- start:5281 stop:5586 length:306 start_codon:yes stop_codon:yes gene_type:complete
MDDQMYVVIYLSLSMGIMMYFWSLGEYATAFLSHIAYSLLQVVFFTLGEQLSGLEIENFEYIKSAMALLPFILLFLIFLLLKILFLYEKYQVDIIRQIFRR